MFISQCVKFKAQTDYEVYIIKYQIRSRSRIKRFSNRRYGTIDAARYACVDFINILVRNDIYNLYILDDKIAEILDEMRT